MSKYEDFEYIKTIKDFNEVINFGWVHFHFICTWNSSNLKVIKYCVEHGADLNIKNEFGGSTPFHLICCNTTTKEVLEYCLQNGTYLDIKNIYNDTPFYYIYRYNKDLIPICKPYMDEYDYVKTLKEYDINWKEYV